MHPKLGIRRKSNSKNWILRENPAFTGNISSIRGRKTMKSSNPTNQTHKKKMTLSENREPPSIQWSIIMFPIFNDHSSGVVPFSHTCSDFSYRIVIWNASVVQNNTSIIPDQGRRTHRNCQSRGSSVRFLKK